MKHMKMLIWLTQLGLSVVAPLGGFVLLAVWLRQRFQWGSWVIIAGMFLGIICAVDGLRVSMKAMEKMSENKKEEKPPLSFNDHN